MEKDKSRALPFIRSLGALPFTSSLIQAHALVRLTRTLCLVCLTQTRTVLYVIVCTCMCIHLYVYMYVCMHVRKHACTYECICHIPSSKETLYRKLRHTAEPAHFSVCMCACACVWVCVCLLWQFAYTASQGICAHAVNDAYTWLCMRSARWTSP